jgi:hypothetical protein
MLELGGKSKPAILRASLLGDGISEEEELIVQRGLDRAPH